MVHLQQYLKRKRKKKLCLPFIVAVFFTFWLKLFQVLVALSCARDESTEISQKISSTRLPSQTLTFTHRKKRPAKNPRQRRSDKSYKESSSYWNWRTSWRFKPKKRTKYWSVIFITFYSRSISFSTFCRVFQLHVIIFLPVFCQFFSFNTSTFFISFVFLFFIVFHTLFKYF